MVNCMFAAVSKASGMFRMAAPTDDAFPHAGDDTSRNEDILHPECKYVKSFGGVLA